MSPPSIPEYPAPVAKAASVRSAEKIPYTSEQELSEQIEQPEDSSSPQASSSALPSPGPHPTHHVDVHHMFKEGWVLARRSQVPEEAWNKEYIQIFSDFNFNSPTDTPLGPSRRPSFDEITRVLEQSEHHRKGSDSSADTSINSTRRNSVALEKALTAHIEPPPYSVLTKREKKIMVYIVSLAGLFSPLSSNIYFPALNQIALDMNVAVSLVSLTVTVYMIVQGLAPSFWGPLSDTKGRRITFIGTFVVYLVSNVALALVPNFGGLMALRAIQAAGSAATISIGAGVIGDITTSKERGGYIGIFGGIRMLGQSVGPVFGGIITQYLGFRAIFWALLISGGLTLALIVLILPETLRSIAGNGTTKLTGLHKPLLFKQKEYPESMHLITLPPKAKITVSSVFTPLKFLFEKDVFITLFFGAIVYTIWSCVTSSTSAIFADLFGFNNVEIGLCFLPNGAGCVSGSYLTGYLMNHDFRKTEAEYREAKGLPADTKLNKKELVDFPMERSRLRNMWWMVIIFVVATALYGYSLKLEILALPLVLQFFIAYTATAVFSLNSALVIDLFPGASASATAVNNLIRCTLGAIGVAFIQQIIDAIGAGPTFVICAGITVFLTPLCFAEAKWGMEWRIERGERLKRKEEERAAAAGGSDEKTSV